MDQQVMDVHAFDTRRHVYASKNEITSNIASAVQYVTPLPAQFNVSSSSSSSSSLQQCHGSKRNSRAQIFEHACVYGKTTRYRQIWADPAILPLQKQFVATAICGVFKNRFLGPTYKKPSGTKWFYYDIQNVKSVDSSVRDGRG
jgi:hypothetical protein